MSFSPVRFLVLGFSVIAVSLISFGPFVKMGQLPQVLSRLFPVQRGLCHAYWAANFWAIYNVIDKGLCVVGRRCNLIHCHSTASLTGGLVAEQQYGVLPSVAAWSTAVVTLASLVPALWMIWYRPNRKDVFLRIVVLCALSSFLFGYHVHEKAIILVTIPLSLLSIESQFDARIFFIVSVSGHFALFPLLYQLPETVIKVSLLLAFVIFCNKFLSKHHGENKTSFGLYFVNIYESIYMWGFVPLYIYTSTIHSFIDKTNRFEFLPLMLISVYCSLGIIWSWILFYKHYLTSLSLDINRKI